MTDIVGRGMSVVELPHPSAVAGIQTLGLSCVGILDVVAALETGFPVACFEALRASLEVSGQDLALSIGVPVRTLSRRRSEGRLSRDESERLLRLAAVYEAAIELFEGNEELARKWLKKSRAEMGGKTPLAMAESEIGAAEVRNLIGRLEHGVFS